MGRKLSGKIPAQRRPAPVVPQRVAGLPLFLIAVVESAKMAQMTEREAIVWLVRLWYGDETADLLGARVRRTGDVKRAPKRLLELMGNGYYWDEVHGCITRDITWKAPEEEPATEG